MFHLIFNSQVRSWKFNVCVKRFTDMLGVPAVASFRQKMENNT